MSRLLKYKIDHILFWSITIGFHVYTRLYLIDDSGWWQFLLEIIIRNGLLALIIYGNSEYLIPEFIHHKKFIAYGIGLILCLAFYILLKNTHDVYLAVFTSQPTKSFWQYSFYNFSIALFYLAFALALQLSKEWFFQRERLRQLEIEKLNTELDYLKSQINPHFLFNSLNTIFFQIDKSNQAARDTLTKFSEMLRFQLYECDGDSISLEQEINYLRNYVDLQRLRKDEKYQIEFTTEGDFSNQKLAPLLFIPIVENAFKHVSNNADSSNKIRIDIKVDNDTISLSVLNTKDNSRNANNRGGIGIKNLIRRLELQYPERHTLELKDNESDYSVKLMLKNSL